MELPGPQRHSDCQAFAFHLLTEHGNDTVDHRVSIDHLMVQPDLPTRDAGKIQEVVNEAGLGLNVAADHRHLLGEVGRDRRVLAFELQLHIEPQICRVAHLQNDPIFVDFGPDDAGRRLKRDRPLDASYFIGESSETSGSVATHFRFATIPIVVAHPKISAIGSFFQQ